MENFSIVFGSMSDTVYFKMAVSISVGFALCIVTSPVTGAVHDF
jgi:hypothetical protein